PSTSPLSLHDALPILSIVMLPAITIGYRYAAVSMRMTRSAMLEVLREDYIRTARAKGLINRLIINRHALKNAMLPVDDQAVDQPDRKSTRLNSSHSQI